MSQKIFVKSNFILIMKKPKEITTVKLNLKVKVLILCTLDWTLTLSIFIFEIYKYRQLTLSQWWIDG